MNQLKMLAAFGVTLLLLACAEPEAETYPLTGAPCHADDPVKEMKPLDCVPPAGV